jgi:glycosyltransferase involved in cell wall biosynthesis
VGIEISMKIIIVNYRYFVSGGPERYLFNISSMLEGKGHTIIPFSVKSKHNKPSAFEKYFLDPIGDGSEVYFNEYKKTSFKTVIKSFSRMFYSFEAKRKLSQLIKAEKPDLIYVLHYQNKISASIFDASFKYKVPVVHRISDFGQICANALFYRTSKKDICERCLNGSKLNAVVNKCVLDSYLYSTIKIASLQLQKIIGIEKKISAYVVPSKFTISKLMQYGFPANKLYHIPTFFNFQQLEPNSNISFEQFALYIGRIEEEKGLMTLVKAFVNTNYSLKIIGSSSTGYESILKQYLADKQHSIEFLGKMEFKDLQIHIRKCAFTIVPSEWYDNFPNSILESYALKKCVIASDTGSLKEMVENNVTGLLFRPKNSFELQEKVEYLFREKETCKKLGQGGYEKLINEYSSEIHYHSLAALFEKAINNNKVI